ncbi:MAG: regulatory protein RecX [Raoultibacter sp.]
MPIIDETFLNDLSARLDRGALADLSSDDEEQKVLQKKAFQKIERLCSVREQSSKALRERLIREGFDECATNEAITRALSCGLLDDGRFADVLIRTRLSAGKGLMGIEAELVRFDIDPESVSGWPSDYGISPETEIDRALLLLQRKPPHTKNMRDAAYRKLVGKGYASSVASTAARLWFESLPESRG